MKKVLLLLLLLFSFALLGTNSARTDSLMIRYSDWNRGVVGGTDTAWGRSDRTHGVDWYD